jgi:hypothetical protein
MLTGASAVQARAGTPGALPGRSASPPLHSHKSQTECFSVRYIHTLLRPARDHDCHHVRKLVLSCSIPPCGR